MAKGGAGWVYWESDASEGAGLLVVQCERVWEGLYCQMGKKSRGSGGWAVMAGSEWSGRLDSSSWRSGLREGG